MPRQRRARRRAPCRLAQSAIDAHAAHMPQQRFASENRIERRQSGDSRGDAKRRQNDSPLPPPAPPPTIPKPRHHAASEPKGPPMPTPTPRTPHQPQPVRAALAAFIGTTVEFYDYYTYATAAALVLGDVFFPSGNRFVSTMASFATFFVGFVARPLSGAVFGHLGDRIGRKKMLVLTMFLMGIATTGIGLLPGYATIGVWAPALLVLLRILQGIAVGGEWGGAVLMASEHASAARRTFFASFPQMGSPAGLILSLLAFRCVTSLDHGSFVAWGWRLPFLASFVLLLIGLAVRLGVNESPEFERMRDSRAVARFPVAEALRTAWYPIVLASAATTIGSAGFFFTNTFMISYVTTYLGMSKSLILDCLFAVTIIQLLSQPVSALIAQRVGETRFLTCAALLSMLTPYPMFVLVRTHDPAAIVAGIAFAVVTLSAVYAVIAGFMTAAFPTRVRYSGISIAYQLCALVAGGTTPLVGTMIAQRFRGEWLPLALFFSLLSFVSLVGIVGLGRYRRKPGATAPHALAANS
ncbi:MFS transporter [Burkholderia thailandensis]|uniref:Major facilitator family transporter n=3 Tax=Burkholderia thailandensis TaxID=57975 RepID=Q2T8Q6_BURTA|nr:major facilitator family transporter [Burkholderia thailandensis E264]AOJ47336.1 LysR family transcriptional regulator [Burkholderia thailandensis]AWY61507.1 MFS transporter [Burkholderia thailandensis]AWY65585.1 MFS transporter [Burkholderia thailandensis]KVG10838.1 LysR family transcriptional regulator [Burkholderia thailandensis]